MQVRRKRDAGLFKKTKRSNLKLRLGRETADLSVVPIQSLRKRWSVTVWLLNRKREFSTPRLARSSAFPTKARPGYGQKKGWMF